MAADAPTQEQDRFEAVVAELNNVCCASFGLAFFLANKYDRDMTPTLEAELERFRKLVEELVALYRTATKR
jgi:hypothetical protein